MSQANGYNKLGSGDDFEKSLRDQAESAGHGKGDGNEEVIGGVTEIKKTKILGKEVDVPLIALCLMNFLLNMACSVITPFFPLLAKNVDKRFDPCALDLSSVLIGLVIGMHPVGGWLFGGVAGKFMVQIGRKRLMLYSLIITVVTLLGMGVSYHLKMHEGAFLAVNLICRFFMGGARSCYGSTTFAYAPMLWPDKVPRMIGILETCTGVGLIIGPVFGAGLYQIFEYNQGLAYQMVFYLISIIFAIFIYPSVVMLPQEKPLAAKPPMLSLGKVMCNARILCLFFLITACSFSLTYTYPLWTPHFDAAFDVKETAAAMYLSIGAVTYMIVLLTLPVIMARLDRKFLMSLGVMTCIVATLFIAPANFLGLPLDQAWLPVVGVSISGAASGLTILPFIPELISQILEYYPQQQYRNMVSDLASGIFYSGYSLGTFLGPVGGGTIDSVYQNWSKVENKCKSQHPGSGQDVDNKIKACIDERAFMFTSYYMTLMCMVVLALYMTVGQGYKGWIRLCKKPKVHAEGTAPLTQQLQQVEGQSNTASTQKYNKNYESDSGESDFESRIYSQGRIQQQSQYKQPSEIYTQERLRTDAGGVTSQQQQVHSTRSSEDGSTYKNDYYTN